MNESKIASIVANNLKRVRLSKHMTQTEVAKGADITSNHYAKIERGEASPNILTLAAILKSLRIKSSKILPF